MIDTFFGSDMLSSSSALVAALLIGFVFGLALERGGFGSSRRLAGIFYFTDMSVFKVMFTALVTACLGLVAADSLGIIDMASQVYFMPTYYGAQVLGGLIFGVGFVMGGWCPGTAMVGMASGKVDAFIFLAGGILGSILYNECHPLIASWQTWGQSALAAHGQPGLAFIYDVLGMSRTGFALILTLIAVLGFRAVEKIESWKTGIPVQSNGALSRWIKPGLVMAAFLLWIAPSPVSQRSSPAASLHGILTAVETARDHVEPEALADLLYRGEPGISLVDVRPPAEYAAFSIRGAVNVALTDLPAFARKNTSQRMIILYSNGMTHPAQARDALAREGFTNLFILTDGLTGFIDRCLKPVSLRKEPASPENAARIRAWRDYFLTPEPVLPEQVHVEAPPNLPGLIETAWLADNLNRAGLRILDCRDQPEYNRGHIPGAYAISPESFRGVVNGVPSVLEPAGEIALKLSLLNISPQDVVVIAYGGDRIRDASLIGLAFERMGHMHYALLNGGMGKWIAEGKPLSTDLPPEGSTQYPAPATLDGFTLDHRQLEHMRQAGDAVILDVRPEDYFSGKKSDEARAGHIPGAVNRDFSMDIDKSQGYGVFKPQEELRAAYDSWLAGKNTPVAVHCRTGHQASQTYFLLKHILGFKKVYWYDAGWTEWAARKELPVQTGPDAS